MRSVRSKSLTMNSCALETDVWKFPLLCCSFLDGTRGPGQFGEACLVFNFNFSGSFFEWSHWMPWASTRECKQVAFSGLSKCLKWGSTNYSSIRIIRFDSANFSIIWFDLRFDFKIWNWFNSWFDFKICIRLIRFEF